MTDNTLLVSVDPQIIHIFPRIHEHVAYYNLIMMMFFIVVGGSIIDVLHGDFFNFGPPFTVSTFKITSDVSWLLFTAFAVIDQTVFVIVEELDLRTAPLHSKHSLFRCMLLKSINIVMFWQRLTFKYVVMRSQLSIIIPVIFVDLLVYCIAKEQAIWARDARILDKSAKSLENIHYFMTIAQLAELPMFIIVYITTGMATSEFFSTQAPVVLAGHTVMSNGVIALISVVIFIDQVGYGFVRALTERWTTTHLQNPDIPLAEMHMSRFELYFVCIFKRVLYWIRLMFSITFLTTRYFFGLIYTVGDIISALIMHCYVTEFTRNTSRLIVLGTVFMLTEMVIVIEVLTVATRMSSTYFTWPDELLLFDNTVTGYTSIVTLLIIASFAQIGATLSTDVIAVDFSNWMYGVTKSQILDVYAPKKKLFILMLTRLDSWFRLTLILQFVLSTFFFVLFIGAVDITVGVLIMNKYIKHKINDVEEAEFTQLLSRLLVENGFKTNLQQ